MSLPEIAAPRINTAGWPKAHNENGADCHRRARRATLCPSERAERTMITSFLAFLGVSAVVIMTPGPDTAVTVRNTLLGGRFAGILTALGISTGQAIWALATSFGVVALLVA